MVSSEIEKSSAFWTARRFALVLALLICITFPKILLGLESFVFRDYSLFGYPLAHYHRECFWHGEIPLWNPFNNSGLPFLAQWNTMVCYPLSLIYLLFPLPWSLGMFCLAHLFLGGLGMFCLARTWTNNPFAAALAGIAFAFSGLALSCLIWPNNIATLAWSPWVLWAMPKAWSSGGRHIVIGAAISAVQMLAGGPEVFLFTWMLVAALFGCSLFGGLAEAATKLKRLVCCGLLFIGLVAVQLFPFVDLLLHSQRHTSFGGTGWSMPPWGWANLILPLFYTDRTSAGVHVQPDQGWASSYYLGLTILAWAILSAWWVRNDRVRVLASLLAVSLIFALGSGGYVYPLFQKVIPLLGFMQFPVKWVILSSILTPLLAAVAFAHLCERSNAALWRSQNVVFAISAFLIVALLVFAWRYPFFPDDPWPRLVMNAVTRIVLLSAAGLLTWALAGKLRKPALILSAQAALLFVVWVDFVTHTPQQNPGVAPHAYTAALPPLAELTPKPTPGVSRVMLSLSAFRKFRTTIVSNMFDGLVGVRLGLYDNCNLLERIPKVDGFYSLYLPHESAVRTRLYQSETDLNSSLADFMSISHTTRPGTFWDWTARASSSPMITGGQTPVFLNASETLNELLNPEFNGRRVVFLPPEAKSVIAPNLATNINLLPRQVSTHLLAIDYDSSDHALIVLAQSFYHRWKASVDGKPLAILRANHAFQAVQVPPGKHTLTLNYDDAPFKAGAALSVSSFLIGLLSWLKYRRGPTGLSAEGHLSTAAQAGSSNSPFQTLD